MRKLSEQNGSLEKEGDPLGWSIQSWCVWVFSFLQVDLDLKINLQDALRVLQPTSDMNDSLDLSKEADAAVLAQLNEVLGGFFAEKVSVDAAWARGILGISSS